MIFRVADIVRDVRVALDENRTQEQLLSASDMETLSLDELIESKVEEAVADVHQGAPAYMLESGHSFGDHVFRHGDGSGHVLLPEDFMRLVSFRMSDWRRRCVSAVSEDSREYALQRGVYAGLRGTPERPVCALILRPEGKVLEYYSCRDEEAAVSDAVYMPWPRVESGGIDISRRCYRAVVYAAAALTAAALGSESARILVEQSKSLLQ